MKEKAMELVNRHLVTTTLSTADAEGNVDAALFNSATMVDERTVVGAHMSIRRSYENLLATRKAVLTVIVPNAQDPILTDGVRLYLDLAADETEGEGFDRLQKWLNQAFGVGFKLQSRLVFKVNEIRPLWEW